MPMSGAPRIPICSGSATVGIAINIMSGKRSTPAEGDASLKALRKAAWAV